MPPMAWPEISQPNTRPPKPSPRVT
jgi:hypothetical protein